MSDHIKDYDIIVFGKVFCPFCGKRHALLAWVTDADYDSEGVVEQMATHPSGCTTFTAYDSQTRKGHVVMSSKEEAQQYYKENESERRN